MNKPNQKHESQFAREKDRSPAQDLRALTQLTTKSPNKHINQHLSIMKTILLALALVIPIALGSPAGAAEPAKPPQVFYRTVKIDGLDIFYREAGPKEAPAVLLLHGFPTSSHMFRNLIPFLA